MDTLKALRIAREMIRGQIIEGAVTDVGTMMPLGRLLDDAIARPSRRRDLTAEEKRVLSRCIRIAIEDGSIYPDEKKVDQVNKAIASIKDKLAL